MRWRLDGILSIILRGIVRMRIIMAVLRRRQLHAIVLSVHQYRSKTPHPLKTSNRTHLLLARSVGLHWNRRAARLARDAPRKRSDQVHNVQGLEDGPEAQEAS